MSSLHVSSFPQGQKEGLTMSRFFFPWVSMTTYSGDFFFHRHDVVVLLFLPKRWWEKEKKRKKRSGGAGLVFKDKTKNQWRTRRGLNLFFPSSHLNSVNRHDHSWQMTRWIASRYPWQLSLSHLARRVIISFILLLSSIKEWNLGKVHSPLGIQTPHVSFYF